MKENDAAKLKGEEGSTLHSVHQHSHDSGCLGFYLQVYTHHDVRWQWPLHTKPLLVPVCLEGTGSMLGAEPV